MKINDIKNLWHNSQNFGNFARQSNGLPQFCQKHILRNKVKKVKFYWRHSFHILYALSWPQVFPKARYSALHWGNCMFSCTSFHGREMVLRGCNELNINKKLRAASYFSLGWVSNWRWTIQRSAVSIAFIYFTTWCNTSYKNNIAGKLAAMN